jgi:hypothetical protein
MSGKEKEAMDMLNLLYKDVAIKGVKFSHTQGMMDCKRAMRDGEIVYDIVSDFIQACENLENFQNRQSMGEQTVVSIHGDDL